MALFPATLALLFYFLQLSEAAKDVVTNQFHVLIKRDANHPNPNLLAESIAKENGFHYLGPVSFVDPRGPTTIIVFSHKLSVRTSVQVFQNQIKITAVCWPSGSLIDDSYFVINLLLIQEADHSNGR